MLQEMIHEPRIILLDDRPPVDERIRLWMGDSRGRWGGRHPRRRDHELPRRDLHQLLQLLPGASGGLTLVERFTRVDADTIEHHYTVNDPDSYTRPWTASVPCAASPARCTSTPATRATTAWRTCCAGRACRSGTRGAVGGSNPGSTGSTGRNDPEGTRAAGGDRDDDAAVAEQLHHRRSRSCTRQGAGGGDNALPPSRRMSGVRGQGSADFHSLKVSVSVDGHVLAPDCASSTFRQGRSNARHSGSATAPAARLPWSRINRSWGWGVSDRHSAGGPAVGAPEGTWRRRRAFLAAGHSRSAGGVTRRAARSTAAVDRSLRASAGATGTRRRRGSRPAAAPPS